jgi:hypothetical protein
MRLNWQETLYPLAVQVIFALGGGVIFGYGGYLVYRDQFLRKVFGAPKRDGAFLPLSPPVPPGLRDGQSAA